jgi:hypothetical protein
MKKLLVCMLCGLLLVGCGKTNSENEVVEDSQTEASQETKEVVSEQPAEESEDIAMVEPEVQLDLDITGCDTFTQIVDTVLEPGMGYTNETIGDTDALLVCTFAYDNMDGNMAAIDSAIYVYNDGVPECIGNVSSIGTAYPLAVKDGYLYVGIYHGTAKYTIENNELIEVESSWIEYDDEGNEEFYYHEVAGEETKSESSDAVDTIQSEYDEATILNFDVIQ